MIEKIEVSENARCEAGRTVLRQVALFCGFLLLTVLVAACVRIEHCPELMAKSANAGKLGEAGRTSGKDKVARASSVMVEDKPALGKAPGEDAAHETAGRIAADLVRNCPPAAPDDQAAFDGCRKALSSNSPIRQSLSDVTLWGPQSKDLAKGLKETSLTQFSSEALAGLHIPLFMFSGQPTVAWSENEKLWRVEIAATFRGRLQPELLPNGLRPEDESWRAYEKTSSVLFWLDPATTRIRFAQFTERGGKLQAAKRAPGHPEAATAAPGRLPDTAGARRRAQQARETGLDPMPPTDTAPKLVALSFPIPSPVEPEVS